MSWATVAAIAAPVVGGLLGADQAKGARNDANNARNEALAQFAGLTIPDIEAMKLNPELFSSEGNLSPELIALITQGDTALSGVSTDPRLRQSQVDALGQMSQVASSGMTPGDQAAFELARRNAAAEAQAKQGQILQNMAQRGQSGAGAELAASLQNAQSSSDRLQMAQLEEAKAKQAARMAALTQQANMAGSLRSADYSEQANAANARDAIARFNAQNAQSVGTANTGARNNAQATNLANNQNIRNQNTQLSNTAQQNNKGLLQQKFNNEVQLASGRAGILNQNANAQDNQAGQTAGMWSGIGQGIGTVGTALLKKDEK